MPDAIPRDLLPCPFCGGRASLSEGMNGDGAPFQYIECDECAAMAELEWWNRRARHGMSANEVMREMARKGGTKGAATLNKRLTPEERSLSASNASKARWRKAARQEQSHG